MLGDGHSNFSFSEAYHELQYSEETKLWNVMNFICQSWKLMTFIFPDSCWRKLPGLRLQFMNFTFFLGPNWRTSLFKISFEVGTAAAVHELYFPKWKLMEFKDSCLTTLLGQLFIKCIFLAFLSMKMNEFHRISIFPGPIGTSHSFFTEPILLQ